MKDYLKPEIEKICFSTEVITGESNDEALSNNFPVETFPE